MTQRKLPRTFLLQRHTTVINTFLLTSKVSEWMDPVMNRIQVICQMTINANQKMNSLSVPTSKAQAMSHPISCTPINPFRTEG